jgi:hypothetical protein
MKDPCDSEPIACCLTTAEFREREATLLARFKSAVMETEELRNGYAFPLPGDRERIRLVTELIVAERECCPFLKFEVVALRNMGPVMVRMTGPAGATEFLKALLCKRDACS